MYFARIVSMLIIMAIISIQFAAEAKAKPCDCPFADVIKEKANPKKTAVVAKKVALPANWVEVHVSSRGRDNMHGIWRHLDFHIFDPAISGGAAVMCTMDRQCFKKVKKSRGSKMDTDCFTGLCYTAVVPPGYSTWNFSMMPGVIKHFNPKTVNTAFVGERQYATFDLLPKSGVDGERKFACVVEWPEVDDMKSCPRGLVAMPIEGGRFCVDSQLCYMKLETPPPETKK